jgi:ATP-dependent helicase/nuclease subunit B
MDLFAALPPQVIEALDAAAIVLTANQRAARTLHHAFDLHQRAAGRSYWEPPTILSWDAWLASLWYQLLLDGYATDLLLNSTQERTLWRAIIAADAATASLRPVDALAQTAADAWRLLHDYRVRNRLPNVPGNSDTRAFTRWADQFDDLCARSHYLTEAALAETLRAAIIAGHLAIANNLLLVGFDSETPAQTELLEAIRAAGRSVDSLAQTAPASSLTRADAPDEHAEFTTCARWLRARLTEQPSSSIAVIVPQIEPIRAEIDRVFRNILAPELEDVASPTATGPYEFSLGVPLAHTPLVATAFDLLDWAANPLPLDRVGALLLSPHFAASDSELLTRAEFDASVLRRQHLLRPAISLEDLYSLVSQSPVASSLTVLRNHLRALRPLFKKDLAKAKRAHADWAAFIHELLDAAGWAVPNLLDSIEFQTRRKWESALDELASLDFDGARVLFADALAALECIATDTLFAPESSHAPIQIMGPLESAGSSFDAVWFLRANDAEWPSTPSPNPLLPFLLQRELTMPGADPAHDSARALRITERIAASAPTVIFSCAQQSAEGHQRPSPILATLRLQHLNASDIAPTGPVRAPIALDDFTDAAPIPHPPNSVLQGGASILQSQAACGFRAFAEHRLFSSALEETSLGLDPSERGSLVHAVLENFWEAVQTQAMLKTMPREHRETQLNRSIDSAFARYYSHPAPGWASAYIDAERQRLIRLLLPWLAFEADQREPFTVKSREETLKDVEIGYLHLNVRVDRVDLAEDKDGEPAGEIILDYKTGSASPKDWLGDRPDAPQLPLYAVVSNTPQLAALAFANVRPGNLKDMTGYEAQPGTLPKGAKLNAPSLAAQVDEWREVLTSLANEFHAGNASVSPKHYPQTCEYCDQRLLCRLNPTSLDADALDDLEDESATEEDELV